MRIAIALGALLATACGRFGFDAGDDQAVGDDAPDAAIASPRYVDEVLADHPVAYYRVDHLDGAVDVADSSGNGQTGSFQSTNAGTLAFASAGAIEGDPDRAFVLSAEGNAGDGSLAAVRFPATLNPWGGDFSYELWLMPSGRDFGVWRNLALFCENFNDNGFRSGWTPDRHFEFWTTDAAGGTDATGVGVLATDRWNHVVVVRAGTMLSFYLDGVLDAQAALTYIPPDATAECRFGPAHGMPAEGGWDDVSIYDYALPVDRIAAHRAAGVGP